MFGGEGTAHVPCHGMVFGILPSNFQSLHFSSKQEWERAALQVNFGAHDLSLSDKPDASGQISEFKWWPRSLRCRSHWKSSSGLNEWKAKRSWVQCLPFLWHTRTASGGQSSSRALFLACEQNLCHGTQWLCDHDPVYSLMPPLSRREHLGLVVRFLFSFFTWE